MANNKDDQLQVDDLMPNSDGILFHDPVSEKVQAEESSAERALITGAQPLLDDIFGWINSEIALTESINDLNPESNIEMTTQVMAQKKLREKLVLLKISLRNMADRFEVVYTKEVAE